MTVVGVCARIIVRRRLLLLLPVIPVIVWPTAAVKEYRKLIAKTSVIPRINQYAAIVIARELKIAFLVREIAVLVLRRHLTGFARMAKRNATPAVGITNVAMASGFPKLVSMVAKTAAVDPNRRQRHRQHQPQSARNARKNVMPVGDIMSAVMAYGFLKAVSLARSVKTAIASLLFVNVPAAQIVLMDYILIALMPGVQLKITASVNMVVLPITPAELVN